MGTRGKFGGSREKKWCFAAFSQHICLRERQQACAVHLRKDPGAPSLFMSFAFLPPSFNLYNNSSDNYVMIM